MRTHLKKYISISVMFVCALMSLVSANAQTERNLSSYEGRNFRFLFMQNEVSLSTVADPLITLDIYLSSSTDASVAIKAFGTTNYLTIKAGEMSKYSFGREIVCVRSEEVETKSVSVESDVPITIYGINSIETSSDMFSAIPVKNWGNEYVVMSYSNDIYRGYSDIPLEQAVTPRKSQFAVVSDYDGTVVTIIPTVQTANGRPAGVPFNVTLNKGETYLVQSLNVQEGGDLSGTVVRSTQPCGVFSGHVRTGVYQSLAYPWASKDHLTEMLFPVSAWGKKYVTMPFQILNQTNATLYRVAGIADSTRISVLTSIGTTLDFLIPKAYDVLTIDSLNYPAVWTADNPIQIMEIMRHDGGVNDTKFYDPSMSGVPPCEQFVPKIMFQVPANAASIPKEFIGHTSMLTVDSKAVNSIRVDGRLLKDETSILSNRIGSSDYYWVRVPLSVGTHVFQSDSGRFSGVLYGYGDADSYSVVMGSSLLPVSLSDSKSPDVKIDTLCGNLSGYFHEAVDNISKSGLDYAWIDKILTMNYNYSISAQTDTSDTYYFSANVINDTAEAYILIYCRDRAGNVSSVSHRFYPLVMEFPYDNSTLDFGSIDWKETKELTATLVNKSKKAYYLNSLNSNSAKVTFSYEGTLPKLLQGGEKFSFTVKVDPNSDFSDIYGEIKASLECDKSIVLKVRAKVTATELETQGYAFGDIILGTDSCADVKIINCGKADNTITGITTSGISSLHYDTTGLFPKVLHSGDTLSIPVCFSPIVRGAVSDNVVFHYGSDGTKTATVTGNGISSEFQDLMYDFGDRRVGTENEYTFTITNTGNVTSNVKYYYIAENSDEFEITQFKGLYKDVAPGGSVQFTVKYIPLREGPARLKGYYEVDADTSLNYSMTIIGNGTLPDVNVSDHDLGEHFIFSTFDSTLTLAKASGSENLTLKSMKVIGGNESSFELDLSPFQNIQMNIGDSVTANVHFAPQFTGVHTLQIEVTSDAAANYADRLDTFYITAKSRAYDTTDYSVSLVGTDTVLACNHYVLTLTVTNTGNVDTSIDSINVENTGACAYGEWKDDYAFPITIIPDEPKEFMYEFWLDDACDGEVTFVTHVAGNADKTVKYNFSGSLFTTSLDSIKQLEYHPGDTLTVRFSGEVPGYTDVPVKMDLQIHTDEFAIRLLEGEYLVEITQNGEKKQIPLVLNEKNDYINVPLIDEILERSNVLTWSIDLNFQTYLTDERDNSISAEIVTDKCFDSPTRTTVMKLVGVCDFDSRQIVYTEEPTAKCLYNYLENALTVDILSTYEDIADIRISNINGQLEKMQTIRIANGSNTVKINLEGLSSGVYAVQIEGSEHTILNKLFIKY